MAPPKRKIKVFPREGFANYDELTTAKGICHHPDCKGKRVAALQYHCKRWHSAKSKPMPNKGTKLKEIPGDLNVDPGDVFWLEGICNHPQCNGKTFKKLRDHLLYYHLNQEKLERVRNNKIRDIPADLKVSPNDVTSLEGRCHHRTCRGKTIKQLKQHLLAVHLKQKKKKKTEKLTEIPADLNIKLADIFNGHGTCFHPDCKGLKSSNLKRHFITKHICVGKPNMEDTLTQIPADLNVKPEELTRKAGICHHRDCNGKSFAKLMHHFLRYHLRQTSLNCRNKLTKIPADLNCAAKDIYAGYGICHHGDCKGHEYGNLRMHFVLRHGPDSQPMQKKLAEIPADLKVEPTDLRREEGICYHADCNGREFAKLKSHFLHYHLKESNDKRPNVLTEIPEDWEGNPFDLTFRNGICNKKGCNRSSSRLMNHYIINHVNHPTAEDFGPRFAPAKCPHCGATGSTPHYIREHMRTYHFRFQQLDPISLSPEETEEYYTTKDKIKEEVRKKNEENRIIVDLAAYLREQLGALKDPSHPLSVRAARVKEEFELLFETPAGTRECSYSSFISFFEFSWMIPKISFEIVERRNGEISWKSSNFSRDPGIADIHQPTVADYLDSGYHRGHLVPAGNYTDVFHAAPTYYYSNIVPTTPKTNCGVRKVMENYIRDMANHYGTVRVAHFPIMGKKPNTLKRGVKIPKAIGTVMFVEQPSGTYVKAWELPNEDTYHLIEDCVRNPLALLQEAKIDVKFSRSSFRYWSRNAKKIQTKLSLN